MTDQVIKKTIEEVTGNSATDIKPDSDLVEDLGISNEEMLNIIKRVQLKLQIELSSEAKKELMREAQSVQDLIDIVQEEYEF